ncbi:MAG TPA: hypothetical protein VJR06_04380 [Nitrososphaerales archaeon]|nr:hypothetical protein [Nitrososphaerales archaeon]
MSRETRLTYKEGKRTRSEQLRHAKEQVSANVFNWAWWYFEFTNLVVPRLSSKLREPSPAAVRVTEKEWDSLVILDACRADAFASVLRSRAREFEGFDYTMTSVESLGTFTPEFLARNFGEGSFSDVVYVTANPYVSTLLPPGKFGEVVEVWRESWDESYDTVLPYDVARAALRAKRDRPAARMVVHFMQPHTPFIGPRRVPGEAFWDAALRYGLDRAKRAYMENLEEAFAVLPPLLTGLGGKVVVTADHGEAWGEHAPPLGVPIYGHPKNVHIPALTTVPWMEVRQPPSSGDGRELLAASLRLTKTRLRR